MNFTFTTEIEHISCGHCGVHFGIEKQMLKALQNSGGKFYCPNGDHVCYSVTTEQKLQKKLEEKSRRITELSCEVARERDIKYMERTQKKRAFTMLKNHRNRTKNGVCPCCTRTFPNLARHMASKHPGFEAEVK